jgi:transposase-like protein
MDPVSVFCPNQACPCPARGQRGLGNIGIHSRHEQRFICKQCHKTFSATKGTVFYRLRTSVDLVVTVVTLLAHGCPLQAIVATCRLDERTVAAWRARLSCLHSRASLRATLPPSCGACPAPANGTQRRAPPGSGLLWRSSRGALGGIKRLFEFPIRCPGGTASGRATGQAGGLG